MGGVEPRWEEVESRGFSHRGEEEHKKERATFRKCSSRRKDQKNLMTIEVYVHVIHLDGWMDGCQILF